MQYFQLFYIQIYVDIYSNIVHKRLSGDNCKALQWIFRYIKLHCCYVLGAALVTKVSPWFEPIIHQERLLFTSINDNPFLPEGNQIPRNTKSRDIPFILALFFRKSNQKRPINLKTSVFFFT